MKLLAFVVLMLLSFAVAQQDFSIYPLTKPLEFGTSFLPLLNEGGLELPLPESSPQASMQYVYPEEGVIYSMRFVEPDPNTSYSMYRPESATTVQIVPEQPKP